VVEGRGKVITSQSNYVAVVGTRKVITSVVGRRKVPGVAARPPLGVLYWGIPRAEAKSSRSASQCMTMHHSAL